ncbi:MAG: hypothetical protein ABSC23_00865 [Bryobacteraceae bacterium]|jgi:hypothetical protein
MGGYLDNYGVATAKRERVVHRIVKWSLLVLATAAVLLFIFQYVIPNRAEQASVNRFFRLLAARDYKQAYAMWGCTDAAPCRDYPMTSFMEDWGSPALTTGSFEVLSGETCGSGVIVDVDAGKAGDMKVWVERKTQILGSLPPNVSALGRCPQGNRIYDFVRDLKYRLRGRAYR